MDRIVGIGGYIISNNENDIIKTFSLASCVAVTVYCPLRRAAGMIHIALPYPTNEENGAARPGYYATTGVPILIDKMCKRYGCINGELKVRLYGGAKSINNSDVFNIGQKNVEAVKSILDAMNIKYTTYGVGGTRSRTIEMYVSTGEVNMLTQPLII